MLGIVSKAKIHYITNHSFVCFSGGGLPNYGNSGQPQAPGGWGGGQGGPPAQPGGQGYYNQQQQQQGGYYQVQSLFIYFAGQLISNHIAVREA